MEYFDFLVGKTIKKVTREHVDPYVKESHILLMFTDDTFAEVRGYEEGVVDIEEFSKEEFQNSLLENKLLKLKKTLDFNSLTMEQIEDLLKILEN